MTVEEVSGVEGEWSTSARAKSLDPGRNRTEEMPCTCVDTNQCTTETEITCDIAIRLGADNNYNGWSICPEAEVA